MIVAIDGPAGAGKSTVARLLAARLGIGYLNTGAMYRAVALLALRDGLDPAAGAALARRAQAHDIRVRHTPDGDLVLLDDEDVSAAIREPRVTALVSQVAAHAEVRRHIVALQRAALAEGDWVVDGRDIATVVAPDAEVKVFLTASAEERAHRRRRELAAGGDDVELGEVLQQIVARDTLDATREESPMRVADDAQVVDTTGLSIDEVVGRLAELADPGREARS